ncbi:hypothetical protein HYV82_03830 [Candidatus Woesearchaeota archaeon]|nr:hypothetical protein [Candidatus Woesearchaeota archaeon]
MRIAFNVWSADEIIQAYIDFIKKRNSKEVFIKYLSDKYGFKEIMEGRLEINDKRLKDLPKKVQYTETMHDLELSQKDWKIEFSLTLHKDSENEYRDKAELSFDKSLNKGVYNHFKEFEPKELK